jgi:predicted regulator of Ras-like GTPase activity (Roadblock/LC7/MglB family)
VIAGSKITIFGIIVIYFANIILNKPKITDKFIFIIISNFRSLHSNFYYYVGETMSFTLSNEQKKKLIKLLQEIVRYADLEALALVTKTGINIAFFSEKETDPDLFSAISAAVSATGSMVTEKMGQGTLYEVTVRGAGGYTILSSAGTDFILIGASREAHSLGLAIRVLRRYSLKIPQVFEEEDKDIGSLVSELKDLLQ